MVQLFIALELFVRQAGKISIAQTANKKAARENIIIFEQPIQWHIVQLSLIITNNASVIPPRVHTLNIAVHKFLHGFQIVFNDTFLRVFSRLNI